MDIETMRNIPLEDFLARLGYAPVRHKGAEFWYRSPYRDEKTASFKVDTAKQLWYDFGTGKGGDIFTLAGELLRSDDFIRQVEYVSEVSGLPLPEALKPAACPVSGYGRDESGFRDVEIRPLQSAALLGYLESRGICRGTAVRTCHEAWYMTGGKKYFAVAFRNRSGGYELRNSFFKGSISPKDVSLVLSGSPVCNVYEGFIDYLSAKELGIGAGEDHIILNSVANVGRAMPLLENYAEIRCWLDNDDAGSRTLERLRSVYGDDIRDMSAMYSGHKDMNEYLTDKNNIEHDRDTE